MPSSVPQQDIRLALRAVHPTPWQIPDEESHIASSNASSRLFGTMGGAVAVTDSRNNVVASFDNSTEEGDLRHARAFRDWGNTNE